MRLLRWDFWQQVTYSLDAQNCLTVVAQDLGSGVQHLWQQSEQQSLHVPMPCKVAEIAMLPSNEAVALCIWSYPKGLLPAGLLYLGCSFDLPCNNYLKTQDDLSHYPVASKPLFMLMGCATRGPWQDLRLLSGPRPCKKDIAYKSTLASYMKLRESKQIPIENNSLLMWRIIVLCLSTRHQPSRPAPLLNWQHLCKQNFWIWVLCC